MNVSIKEHLQAFALHNSTLTQEAQDKFNAILIDKLTNDHIVCKSKELHDDLDALINRVVLEAFVNWSNSSEDSGNTIERQELIKRVVAQFLNK